MELIATNGDYGMFKLTESVTVQGWENCATCPKTARNGDHNWVMRGRAGGLVIINLLTWEPASGVTFKRREAEVWLDRAGRY